MKERPIIFSGDMVKAILDGSKTQTRRVIKILPSDDSIVFVDWGSGFWPFGSDDGESHVKNDGTEKPYNCPYGVPGDRLWVRESFNLSENKDAVMYVDVGGKVAPGCEGTESYCRVWHTKPSIHMPRWASRITLEITGVHVERLQDISEEDAKAEGVDAWSNSGNSAVYKFLSLWDKINGKKYPSWASNVFVWVVEFKKIEDAQD